MRKKSVKTKKKATSAASSNPTVSKNQRAGRRNFLKTMAYGGVGFVALGGLGYYSITTVQARICEGDLTRIGQGKPAIVQIHDPQCSLCRTLQNQTRDVLSGFDGDQFEYLVANVKSQKGSSLAAKYSVPHVTLLLFDGSGKMVQTVRGPTSTDVLNGMLGAFLEEHGKPNS